MGIIIRQSVKSSIAAYVGVAIGTVNNLWLYTKFLTVEEVGLLRVLPEAAVLIASLCLLGLPNAALRFFPLYEKKALGKEGFFSTLSYIALFSFLLLASLFVLLKNLILGFYLDKAPLLTEYYYFVLPIVFVTCGQTLFETYCAVYNRITVPTLIREIFLKLANSTVILLYGLEFINFKIMVVMLVIGYGISLVFLVVYMATLFKWTWRIETNLMTRKELVEILKYGSYVFLVSFGIVITTRIDLIMIPAYLNLDSAGIYGIAAFFALVIEIPKRGITRIASPIISKAIEENNKSELYILYYKSSINQMIAGLSIFGLIIINLNEIFAIMPNGTIYSAGKNTILILGFSKVMDLGLGLNGEILAYSKYYRSYFYSTLLLAFLTVFTNMLLIPTYGLEGAATATTMSVGIYSIVKLILVRQYFGIQPFSIKTLLVLVIFCLSSALGYSIEIKTPTAIETIMSMALKSSLFIASTVLFTYYLRVSEDFNNLANLALNKIKSTFK